VVPMTAVWAGLDAGLDEEGFQERGGLLHGPGADEHLGDVDLVAAELGPHDVHGSGHGVEDLLGGHALGDGLTG
jgi:hypothetical protein